MNRKNPLSTIGGILLLTVTIISGLAMFCIAFDYFNLIVEVELYEPDIYSEAEYLVYSSYLEARLSAFISGGVVALLFLPALFFTIACFTKNKKLAIVGAVMNLIASIFTFVVNIILEVFRIIIYTVLASYTFKISDDFIMSTLFFVLSLITAIFILSLTRKSCRNPNPPKASMILPLIFIAVNIIKVFATDFTDMIAKINPEYLGNADLINLVFSFAPFVGNILYFSGLVIFCIWLGKGNKPLDNNPAVQI